MKIVRVNDENFSIVLPIISNKVVGFDIETSSTNKARAHTSVIQVYVPERETSFLFPMDVIDASLTQEHKVQLIEAYKTMSIVGHNLYYDTLIMYRDFGALPLKIEHDTYILAIMRQCPNKGLKALAIEADPTLVGKIKSFTEMMGYDPDDNLDADIDLVYSFQNKAQVMYMALDPYLPFIVYDYIKDPKLTRAYQIELNIVLQLSKITAEGLLVDYDKYLAALQDLDNKMVPLQAKIDSIVGWPLRVNSVADVQKALWEERQLPETPLKTKTGKCATSEESLKYLEGDELVDAILEMKHHVSANSSAKKARTYFDENNRIHPTFLQLGFADATSRIYTTDPSLNQWPWEVRAAIIPDKGKKFVYFDWSSAELYIACYFAKQEDVLAKYAAHEDLHSYLSGLLLGVEHPDKSQREVSKVLTFATMYGSEGGAVARKLRCSEEEARSLVERYLKVLNKVRALRDSVHEEAIRTHMTKTVFDRPRALPNLYSPETFEKGKRQAFNTMIQGSCADFQKTAIAKLFKISQEDPRFNMKFTVFDSFLIEVDESVTNAEIETVLDKLSDFSDIFPGFKFNYSYGISYDWLSAKELA